MKNEDIHDSQLSQTTSHWTAYYARLDHVPYGWYPINPLEDSWLQVDLLRQTIITGLITQGQSGANHYINGYRIITSLDRLNWNNVTDPDDKFEVGLLCLKSKFV